MTFQAGTSQTRTSPSWCPETNRRPSPLKAPTDRRALRMRMGRGRPVGSREVIDANGPIAAEEWRSPFERVEDGVPRDDVGLRDELDQVRRVAVGPARARAVGPGCSRTRIPARPATSRRAPGAARRRGLARSPQGLGDRLRVGVVRRLAGTSRAARATARASVAHTAPRASEWTSSSGRSSYSSMGTIPRSVVLNGCVPRSSEAWLSPGDPGSEAADQDRMALKTSQVK